MTMCLSGMHDAPPLTPAEHRPPPTLTTADQARGAAALDAASSANTRRAYRAGWQRWQAWASARGAPAMPAAPGAVAAYLSERAETVSVATVSMDRAAIAAAHRATGAADPCRHAGVRRVLAGIARQREHIRGTSATVSSLRRSTEAGGRQRRRRAGSNGGPGRRSRSSA